MRYLILILVFVTGAFGQSLSGTVLDSRGDAISGAEVILENVGAFERTITGVDGAFTFATGVGKLTVSASGFEFFKLQIERERIEPLTVTLQPAGLVGDVNVSVTRSDTLQSQNAASIAVITIDSLTTTAARTVDDTLRQVAGMQLFRRSSSRTTNPTAQGANLRGVSGSGASRATVLFDGLSINDAFGGWTYWSRAPLVAVEQIEVGRGGASAFYGSGALSGAINIVPIKLDEGEKVRFRLDTSLATQNTADASGILLASRGKWEVALTGDIFKTAGYIPVEEDSRGLADTPAASRHSNAILKLGRRFGQTGRAFIRGNLYGERRDNGTSLTTNRTNFRQLAAGLDTSGFVVRVFGERQVYDQTFSSVSTNRNTESLTRIQRVPSTAFGTSISWSRKISQHSLGAALELQNARGFSEEIGYFAGVATSTSRSGGSARDVSLFVRDDWDIARRVTLNISARVDRRRNSDGVAFVRSLSTGMLTETIFPERTDDAFSPRIGAVYKVSENVSVYGSYSSSFRAPSLNELYRGFRVGNIVTSSNANLTPERAVTFEGGGSGVIFNRRLIMRASAYHVKVNDPIVSVTFATTPTLITRERRNVGSTTSRGLELDLEARPVPGLSLSAMYQLVDAQTDDFPADATLVGRRLPQVPRNSFSAQALYRFRERWSFSTQMRAGSSQFEDDRNTLKLRGLFTADTRVSYRFPYFVETFASIENVFDARYDIALTPVRSVAAPRSLRLGLRIDFSKR